MKLKFIVLFLLLFLVGCGANVEGQIQKKNFSVGYSYVTPILVNNSVIITTNYVPDTYQIQVNDEWYDVDYNIFKNVKVGQEIKLRDGEIIY